MKRLFTLFIVILVAASVRSASPQSAQVPPPPPPPPANPHWVIAYYPDGGGSYTRIGGPTTNYTWQTGPISPCYLLSCIILLNPGEGVEEEEGGSVHAVLTWVDGNGQPIIDPAPPNEVWINETAIAQWALYVTDPSDPTWQLTWLNQSASSSVPGQYVEESFYGGISGTFNGSRLLKKNPLFNGTVWTITLDAATLNASITGIFSSYSNQNWAFCETYCAYNIWIAPIADCYDFENYPNPPPAGSTPLASQTATMLSSLSDGTAYDTHAPAGPHTNRPVAEAVGQLQRDAIFYVFGHGGDPINGTFLDYQTFWSNGRWSFLVQTTSAKNLVLSSFAAHVPPYGYVPDVQVLDDLPAGCLSKLLLAVFEGCWTAHNGPTYGDPVDGVIAKGARAALGWTVTIYGDGAHPGAQTWATTFWQYLQMGKTLDEAITAADRVDQMDNAMKFHKLVPDTESTRSMTITPARNGGS